MTPEGRVKVKVKKVLEYYRSSIYVHMPVQNGMGKPSLDFVGCFWGFFFAVETKAPGKVPTERQEQTIADMRAAGAKVFVIDGDVTELATWLEEIDREQAKRPAAGQQGGAREHLPGTRAGDSSARPRRRGRADHSRQDVSGAGAV